MDCYAKGDSYTPYGCTLSGRQCVDVGQGTPACAVTGSLAAPCPDDKAYDGCPLGSTAVRHCVGGRLAQTEFDCSAVGRTCRYVGNAARCAAASDDCTPFDTGINDCGEGGISICVGGVKLSFDCGALLAADGGTTGTCAPQSTTQTPHCAR